MKAMPILIAVAATALLTPAAHAAPPSIDDYLAEVMGETGVPGLSVVVTRGDRVVHAAGYGEDSQGAPVTEDTPMRIASVSKSFTAMAVMTLVEDGRIALDEPVADQLPGFTMADPRFADVTVRHLLNQTSGFSDTTIDVTELETSTVLADHTAKLAAGSLAADPGTRYEYCNVNYDLAARLVEVASGRPFGDYLKEHVFGPLGMSRSTVGADVPPADGYNSVFGAWLSRPELPGFLASSGSGGVVTTAADMGRWLISQTGNGTPLVSPESLRVMHTSSTVDYYAMGWIPHRGPDGVEQLIHPGNLFTYSAVQAIVPATGHGFAVLANSASLYDETYDVLNGLIALSQGRDPERPGGGRQSVELVLGLIALAATGLGVLGVRRSGRWARRRAGTLAWRVASRFLPLLVPAALLAAYPDLITILMGGRTVTWAQLTYFPLPLTITVVVAALAGVATATARLLRLRATAHAG
ncbi:serine hydrolase domain-containing protein [Saccharothrix texasensis]|uniref:CubicO group peptidase (Beta-lactamase class C family) n=1 Tax=Saccharothrix texasensis TaxID=103734 RepID=A0A3N1H385_9PSEU|nr:serine hydrolase domain-containing protein [Saccharothrix texasensis]ROP36983.1 CubicO group peptidase (beta-lactamase class C family) [Saccharothrix texasensis]